MSQETSDVQQLVVFTHAGEPYALPIARVQEIIRYQRPRGIGDGQTGVISLRGRIVSVNDLGHWLGLAGERDDAAKVLILESEAHVIGIVVDDIDGVISVPAAEFQEPPVAGAAIIDAIVKVDDQLIACLDPDSLLDRPAPTVAPGERALGQAA